MRSLWDRLDLEKQDARLTAGNRPQIEAVVRTIELQKTPEACGLDPLDWLAALAFAGLGNEEGPGPTLRQQKPSRPELRDAMEETVLKSAFPNAGREARLALAAGLLQIHDFWDDSHHEAQLADDLGEARFSAYWHGIAHRREPDAGNALYWFRRVGRHSLFDELATASRPILDEHDDQSWTGKLVGSGGWSPGAMIDLCVSAPSGSPRERLARRLQRLEMRLLLDATASAL